jgi:hypothetical protein
MKIVFLSILLFVACNADVKSTGNKELKVLIDSLFSSEFENKYMQDEVRALTNKLADVGGRAVVNAFFNFALNNTQYGEMVINALFDLHPQDLSIWIRSNKQSFSVEQWELIATNYELEGYKWNDSILSNTITDNALSQKDNAIRNFLLASIARSGTFKEISRIKVLLNKETSPGCRRQIFKALCRYKNNANDSILKTSLENFSESNVINRWLESGLQEYSRYDFLPELYALKSRLEKVKDVTKVAEAKETLEILKTVIPYLEQKKAENAPIGLPLNWPEGNVQK